jgi:hypothetical protein
MDVIWCWWRSYFVVECVSLVSCWFASRGCDCPFSSPLVSVALSLSLGSRGVFLIICCFHLSLSLRLASLWWLVISSLFSVSLALLLCVLFSVCFH